MDAYDFNNDNTPTTNVVIPTNDYSSCTFEELFDIIIFYNFGENINQYTERDIAQIIISSHQKYKCMQDIINAITEFETKPENQALVCLRQRLWFYMEEINKHPYTKMMTFCKSIRENNVELELK
jgi:hypothetical protein